MGNVCVRREGEHGGYDDDSTASSSCSRASSHTDSDHLVEGGTNAGEKASAFAYFSLALQSAMAGSGRLMTADDLRLRSSGSSSKPKFLTVENTGKVVTDSFEFDKGSPLGLGGYAEVKRGRNKATNVMRAIKCISKAKVKKLVRLQEEIDTNLVLDHPNVAKLFQTFEDSRFVYLVMELCEGGDVFDTIIEQKHLTEPDVAAIMQQLLHAIFYIQSHGVCHRDIKPENLLLLKKAPIQSNVMKLIDFGLAKTFDKNSKSQDCFSTKLGTVSYIAPEILYVGGWSGKKYGPKVDIWSCGVVMYAMLSGSLPFNGQTDEDTMALLRLGKFAFPPQKWGNISDGAKEVIRNLMRMDPNLRFSAEEALCDSWVADRAPQATGHRLQAAHIEALRTFQASNQMRKSALQVIARHLGEAQLDGLRQIFTRLDVSGDGVLSVQELQQGLQQADNLPPGDRERCAKMFAALDVDGSGQIDYTEFLAATLARRQYLDESVCWAAFKVFDRDDDGRISLREMASALSVGSTTGKVDDETVRALMAQADLNSDGYIDFAEFKAMLAKG